MLLGLCKKGQKRTQVAFWWCRCTPEYSFIRKEKKNYGSDQKEHF